MARIWNFSAGPAVLPLPVLEEIQSEIVDFKGAGMSIIEASHRSKIYDQVHSETTQLVIDLLGVPDSHQVLFLQGGATGQFSMVPMNLMTTGKADFVHSGAWAKKAIADAKVYGEANIVWDGAESNYMSLPVAQDTHCTNNSSYFHITSNETIGGVQWKDYPDTSAPLVADMSSDILCKPIPVEKFGLIYAGAQKNLGPAGVTLVIIRKDLLERQAHKMGAYLKYSTHAEKDSLYNTPPVFAIYAMGKVLKWVQTKGGAEGIEKINEAKAQKVYGTIDKLNQFYSCPVDPAFRSTMNVVFRLPSEDLEKKFVAEAKENNLDGLKGHRSVGGCRASLYNSLDPKAVDDLVSFMEAFAAKNG